jgi:hypothetical protein
VCVVVGAGLQLCFIGTTSHNSFFCARLFLVFLFVPVQLAWSVDLKVPLYNLGIGVWPLRIFGVKPGLILVGKSNSLRSSLNYLPSKSLDLVYTTSTMASMLHPFLVQALVVVLCELLVRAHVVKCSRHLQGRSVSCWNWIFALGMIKMHT